VRIPRDVAEFGPTIEGCVLSFASLAGEARHVCDTGGALEPQSMRIPWAQSGECDCDQVEGRTDVVPVLRSVSSQVKTSRVFESDYFDSVSEDLGIPSGFY